MDTEAKQIKTPSILPPIEQSAEEIHAAKYGERTEEDILGRRPLIVRLGDRDYEIPPATVLQVRLWRAEYARVCATAIGNADAFKAISTEDPERFGQAIHSIFVALPDEMLGLLFTYCPALPREEIEKTATEEQAVEALVRVVRMAKRPFVRMQALMSG